jgi:hypothetical protein
MNSPLLQVRILALDARSRLLRHHIRRLRYGGSRGAHNHHDAMRTNRWILPTSRPRSTRSIRSLTARDLLCALVRLYTLVRLRALLIRGLLLRLRALLSALVRLRALPRLVARIGLLYALSERKYRKRAAQGRRKY